jgi:hypothetical protein
MLALKALGSATFCVLITGSQFPCVRCNVTVIGMLNYLYQLAMYYRNIELLNSITDRDTIGIQDVRKINPEDVRHECK